jgi:hypothetical protein
MIVITILIILDADTECLINSEFKIFRAVGCMTNITPGTIVSILLLQALPEPGVVFNINNNNAHTHTHKIYVELPAGFYVELPAGFYVEFLHGFGRLCSSDSYIISRVSEDSY